MFKHRLRAPSPAFIISLIALFLALGGTSYAATKVTLTQHKDAKADTTLVKRLAPSLSVKHAKTADNATNAVNATNAGERDARDERRQRDECDQRDQRDAGDQRDECDQRDHCPDRERR
jgi:cell division protein FtsN